MSAGTKVAEKHSRGVRLAFVIGGHVCIVLAVFGIILPVMPATVFLLLAAACYARGSRKFYDWLLENKWFGPPIRDWQRDRSMTVRSKVVAITSLWVGIGVSVVFFAKAPGLRIVLGGIALGVTVLILLIKTRADSS